MDKDSVLYLLMDMRVNGILDRILEKDEEYQEIARKSGEYLDRLEAMDLPQEALACDMPAEYPIPENKRINKYKEKWCA